jgi:hypothetical protein
MMVLLLLLSIGGSAGGLKNGANFQVLLAADHRRCRSAVR